MNVLKRNSAGALIRNAATGALCSTCCCVVLDGNAVVSINGHDLIVPVSAGYGQKLYMPAAYTAVWPTWLLPTPYNKNNGEPCPVFPMLQIVVSAIGLPASCPNAEKSQWRVTLYADVDRVISGHAAFDFTAGMMRTDQESDPRLEIDSEYEWAINDYTLGDAWTAVS